MMVWRRWQICSFTEPDPSVLPWPYKKMLFLLFELHLEYRGLWCACVAQPISEGGKVSRNKCKSVYVGIREEREVGGMTGFHVRKWTSSLRTPVGVGVEGRLTAWLASGNLPCFQQSEKNIIFIAIKKCFCTYSVCKWVLQCCSVEG